MNPLLAKAMPDIVEYMGDPTRFMWVCTEEQGKRGVDINKEYAGEAKLYAGGPLPLPFRDTGIVVGGHSDGLFIGCVATTINLLDFPALRMNWPRDAAWGAGEWQPGNLVVVGFMKYSRPSPWGKRPHIQVGLFDAEGSLLKCGRIYEGDNGRVGCNTWGPGDEAEDPFESDCARATLGQILRLSRAGATAFAATANPKNPSRAKRGKKPLFDWRTVKIEPRKPPSVPRGGTHASPAAHNRRGHWVTSKLGKRFYRKDCRVGNAANGVVFQDYVKKDR